MEAPPVTVMPVTGGTINMMEYLLQGETSRKHLNTLYTTYRLQYCCGVMGCGNPRCQQLQHVYVFENAVNVNEPFLFMS